MNASFYSLKESVYASLVKQTRLKPYLDQIDLVIDDSAPRCDATALNQTLPDKKAADPENYLADLLDLQRITGSNLNGTGWDSYGQLRSWLSDAATDPAQDAVKELRGKRRLISRRWRDGECANDDWRVAV